MSDRKRIPPLSAFEEEIGFTRALRVGDHIFVAGTVAEMAEGATLDAGAQWTWAGRLDFRRRRDRQVVSAGGISRKRGRRRAGLEKRFLLALLPEQRAASDDRSDRAGHRAWRR